MKEFFPLKDVPYEYLEEEAIADTAINAWGTTLNEMFHAAVEAVLDMMISRDEFKPEVYKEEEFEDKDLEMVLFDLLSEIIYWKDAEQFFYKDFKCEIQKKNSQYLVKITGYGGYLDPSIHSLGIDVKAITLHEFKIWKNNGEWWCHFIVDV